MIGFGGKKERECAVCKIKAHAVCISELPDECGKVEVRVDVC